jgi:ATP-binding cassette subfamily F protein 3
MNLLQLHNGSKHFGTKVIFDSASFAVNDGEHVGVIGPNGAGKTTLFKILAQQDSLDEGRLITAKGLRIGYLEQESEWRLDLSAEEYLIQNCVKPIWQLKQIGKGLGLSEAHFGRPLHELSGGYRMRMKLLYLVGQEPNLMLLDEPTNFLDLESVLALETFLQDYNGAFLLISHDREFLRRTTEYTLEVESGDIAKFPGNIDDYFEQKEQLRAILEAQAANLEAKRKHMQDFVDRFRAKATKAKQAQSRMKALEKMETVEIKDLPVRAKIRIPAPIHTGKESVLLKDARLGYGDKVVLQNVRLRMERGDHFGVVGFNGTGKSTLLKSLAGVIPLIEGERTLGYQVSLSYFSQHSADQLDMNDSVLDSLQKTAHRDLNQQDILNMAGSLLFSGDDVHKKVRVLSGGEKSRVALGQILLKKSPLLLLDEPTNHLDFDTVEALTEALRDYEGTVMVVSHDRGFIGRVANRILEIHDGRVELYPGTYDEYVWSLQKGALSERLMTSAAAPLEKKAETSKFNFKDSSKHLQAQIKEQQRKIAKAEEKVAKLEKERSGLNEKLISASGAEAAEFAKKLGLVSQDIEKLEEEIMTAMELQHAHETELAALK